MREFPTVAYCNVLLQRDARFSQWEVMKIAVFWNAMPCTLVGMYWCFGGTYCLHLDGRPCNLSERPNDITSQNTIIFVLLSVL
jgi:hypothetical protein